MLTQPQDTHDLEILSLVTPPLRSVDAALTWLEGQHADPDQDWTGWCQKLARSAYNIPALYSSAHAQWVGADDADRHAGGDAADAPLGSALLYKGSGPHGHIMIAARGGLAWTNDLARPGGVDLVARTAPTTQWGQAYLGWLSAINDVDLPLAVVTPKPKPTPKRYARIGEAIDRLRLARASARRRGDTADELVLDREIQRLKRIDDRLRKGKP